MAFGVDFGGFWVDFGVDFGGFVGWIFDRIKKKKNHGKALKSKEKPKKNQGKTKQNIFFLICLQVFSVLTPVLCSFFLVLPGI